jgi:PHD/YefM family antitoxin component YafN of YafNO toxin-antitoxin module
MADTVTIPRKEYERLKRAAAKAQVTNDELLEGLKESLADVKAGRVYRLR